MLAAIDPPHRLCEYPAQVERGYRGEERRLDHFDYLPFGNSGREWPMNADVGHSVMDGWNVRRGSSLAGAIDQSSG